MILHIDKSLQNRKNLQIAERNVNEMTMGWLSQVTTSGQFARKINK